MTWDDDKSTAGFRSTKLVLKHPANESGSHMDNSFRSTKLVLKHDPSALEAPTQLRFRSTKLVLKHGRRGLSALGPGRRFQKYQAGVEARRVRF